MRDHDCGLKSDQGDTDSDTGNDSDTDTGTYQDYDNDPVKPYTGAFCSTYSTRNFLVMFWSLFRTLQIPHLSVINFMMKPPNPAQNFQQNILYNLFLRKKCLHENDG